jgi:hypothetical protein
MSDRIEWIFLPVGMLIGACVAVLVLLPFNQNITKREPNTTISADGDTVTIKSEGSTTLHVKAKAKEGTNVDGAPILTWDEDGGTWNGRWDDLVDYPKRGETQ